MDSRKKLSRDELRDELVNIAYNALYVEIVEKQNWDFSMACQNIRPDIEIFFASSGHDLKKFKDFADKAILEALETLASALAL